jgi:hypothetical protein
MHEYDDDRTYQKFVLNYSSLASSRSCRRAMDAVVSTVRLGLLAGAQKSVMVLLKKEVTKSLENRCAFSTAERGY